MKSETLRSSFRHLTDDDVGRLLELASARSYKPGEWILEKGATDRSIIIVTEGFVRVERSQEEAAISLARLGPGEVIGEMSFVESGGATAYVRAEQAVSVDVIAEEDMQTLLTSDPGFSARFYRSLALVLAARLREASERLAGLSMFEAVQADPFHTPQTGQLSDRQVPDDLVRGVRDLIDTMRQFEERSEKGGGGQAGNQERVAEVCDGLVRLLEELTDDEALMEITFDDLLAFRDPEQVGAGIGGRIFRETYPFLMASATIARCYMKPRGFSDDHETIAAIYRNDAEGDGAIGPLVDRWFLSRPLCRSRRNLRDMMAARLNAKRADDGASAPMEISVLASGTAAEIFDLLAADPSASVCITCVDRDEEALRTTAERANRIGASAQVRLVQTDLLRLARGHERLSLPPQAMIYSLGLLEYLEEDRIVELLNWAHAQLASDGAVVLSNLHVSNPDRVFMEYMLDWKLFHRTEEQLHGIFDRSAFRDAKCEISFDETKSNMLVVCAKAQ